MRLHVERQRDKLIDFIDSESGLLNILLRNRVLTNREIRSIKSELTSDSRNEVLLEYISENDRHQGLMAALSESHQIHVVNWISADGSKFRS